MKKEEQLKRQIKKLKEELNELKNPPVSPVITSDKYSDEEKVLFFDKLHKSLMEHFDYAVNNGYTNEDDPHYIYEEAFSILNLRDTKELWKYFKKVTN